MIQPRGNAFALSVKGISCRFCLVFFCIRPVPSFENLAVTMSNSHLPCSWWYLNKPHLNQWTLHTTLLRNLLTWTAPSYWWKYHATVALKLSEGKKLSNTSGYLKVSNFGYSILLSVITVWWQWVNTEVHFWHRVRLYQPTKEVDRASIAGCLQKQNLQTFSQVWTIFWGVVIFPLQWNCWA